MGCFTKFFLFVLNFIVFILGAAVTGLASYLLYKGREWDALLSTGAATLPVVFLVLGVFILLLGFFGCFGALRESPCLLYTYASIVLVLLLAQIGLVIYGTLEKDALKEQVQEFMKKEAFLKYGHGDEKLTESLDAAQQKLECCGVTNYTDWWGDLEGANVTGGDVPRSCCKNTTDATCQKVKRLSPKEAEVLIYTIGCFTQLDDQVEGHALWMIIAAVVLALVQLGCVVIACGIGKRASSSHYA